MATAPRGADSVCVEPCPSSGFAEGTGAPASRLLGGAVGMSEKGVLLNLPRTALPPRVTATERETMLGETGTRKGGKKLLVLGVLVFILALVNTVCLKSQA